MNKTAALSNELFFITTTVIGWINVFTRPEYCDFIIENLEFCQEKKGLKIFEYVLMTNHLHLICLGDGKPLSDILRDFKTFSSKELFKMIRSNPQESRKVWLLPLLVNYGQSNPLNKHHQFWENYNSPTLLDNNLIIDQKTEYIHMNPVKAGIVAEPYHYVYSSANENSPLKTYVL